MSQKENSAKPPAVKAYLGLLLLACLAGGGATMWFLGRRASEAHHERAAPGAIKDILHLEDFVVNLADRDSHAFVKIGIDIGQTEAPQGHHDFAASPVPAVRDAILAVIAKYQSDELLTPEGKTKLKRELLQAVQQRAPQAGAAEIYFTEFLVQR
jgi:flagellar FliL protein